MRRLLVNATVAVGVVLRLTLATVRAEEPVNAAEPSANAPAVEVVPTPLTGHRLFVGAGACAASGCHGGDKNSAAAWQSSYTVWATADKHALAYRVLYDELAHKIVQKLDRATDWKTTRPYEDRRCLGCHATADPGAPRASLRLADGVSCESCHGAARPWVKNHVMWKPGEVREQAARHGMKYTKDIEVRAAACVDCHVGAPAQPGETVSRDMNHDMIAAGHPRLNFEFTSYLAAMPAHWKHRPTGHDPQNDAVRAWAVGQLVTGRASLELLADRAGRADRDQTGTQAAVWPEFAEYDCFSCHHSLRGLEDRPRSTLARRHAGDTHRVGGYDWGAWHMTMPSWLARLEAPEAAQPKLEPLQKLTATMSQPFPEPRLIMRDSQQAARVFDPWIERVARQHFDRADLKKQFVELASTAQTHTWDQAAQAYLACVAFHQARNPEGSSSLSAADQAVADALNRIFPGLRFKADERAKFNSPQDFDAARLGADFVKLAAAVNNLEP